MSYRLPTGGRLIDRDQPLSYSFNGAKQKGFAGDTLAAALLANDQMLVGRSFKYHRPRGIVAYGPEEPNALMNMGAGPFFEPNQRATTTPLTDGMEAESQNHWPSLETDVGAVNGMLSRFLSAGFYYKTFIHPRPAWKHLFEPFIRQSAGLGKAPKDRDGDTYEHTYAFADVVVIGGGIAGLQAALDAANSGVRVFLMEMSPVWGGRAPIDGVMLNNAPAQGWIDWAVGQLASMPNVRMKLGCMGAGVYDHGYLLAYEQVAGYAPGGDTPRHRLWRIRAGQIITATGAIERPLSFAGNDTPGVMLAASMRDYLVNHAVAVGKRTVIVTNNDDAYRTALALQAAGLEVPAICDLRTDAHSSVIAEAEAAGMSVRRGKAVVKVKGRKRVESVVIGDAQGTGEFGSEVACDAVAMSGGWSPAVHLFSHVGGKLLWDADNAMFRPDVTRLPTNQQGGGFVRTAGTASGHLDTADALQDAQAATGDALTALGTASQTFAPPVATPSAEAPILGQWIVPAKAAIGLREKTWLDFQNDVKVSDVQLAAREGFESVEHTKRYTTLGMATDQGKLSNINGLAILGDALGKDIPQVGTTTFRPPYTPISLGAIAGEARGEVFQPLRRTPMHDWH
ncbi:MAG: 2Fe-2S iron-sulfur cluster-binding protein, partial [Pseudomonadota bacterium]